MTVDAATRTLLLLALRAAGVPEPCAILAVEVFAVLETAAVEWMSPATLAEVSAAIIAGINRDHPDWSADKRAQWAADAIALYGKVGLS